MDLSPAARLAYRIGEAEARSLRAEHLDPEHLVIAVLKAADLQTRPDGLEEAEWAAARGELDALRAHWRQARISPDQMRRRLRYLVAEAGGGQAAEDAFRGVSARCQQVLDAAPRADDGQVGLAALLGACVEASARVCDQLLTEFAVGRPQLVPGTVEAAGTRAEAPPPPPAAFQESPIARFGRDLTALAHAGALLPVVGRREEMKDVARILSQAIRNNAMLVGDAGVGKTAVVEGLAQYAASEGAHPAVRDLHLVEITMVSLIAGAHGSAEVAERLLQVLRFASEDPNLVLFFDEFHTMVGAGDILKPALARGEIHCIGATTIAEYQNHVERDPALARRFQKVWVKEPTRDETFQILQGLRPRLEEHHAMRLPDGTLHAAIDLTTRFVPSGRLPDKAIILLDQACAQHRLMTFTPSDSGAPTELTVDAISQAVAKQANLPLSRVTMTDVAGLAELEAQLATRVVGQPTAVSTLAAALQLMGVGLEQEGRPFVVMFAGPSGTGKTELAKAVSATMFGEEDRLITLDMANFREEHQRSKLIGSPVGYVGSDETPAWITAIERQPDSVVLLDEVEKAHPSLLTLFLPVFDEGRLETARGKVVDLSHAIFVLTSNLGTTHRAPRQIGFPVGGQAEEAERDARQLEYEIRQAIAGHLLPEILGRIREVVVFQPLTRAALDEILDLHLDKLNRRRGLVDRGIEVTLAADAKDLLVEQGYSIAKGARELITTLDRLVTAPLARALIAEEITAGARVHCRRDADALAFDVATGDQAETIALPPQDDLLTL